MSNVTQKILISIAVAACVALAGAQGGQGGQGGQGRGQRGGFGQRGMMRGGGESGLVRRADVQKELGITDEQKTKLEEMATKEREARRAAFQNRSNDNGGAATGGGQQGRRMFDPAAMAKQREEQHKALAAILDAKQMKRLGELSLQQQGARALTQEETQKALGLSADQVAKIKDIQTKEGEAMQSLMEKMRNQELTREEMQASMEKNNKALTDELTKVLTTDQAAKFKEMQGAPFKFEDNNGGF